MADRVQIYRAMQAAERAGNAEHAAILRQALVQDVSQGQNTWGAGSTAATGGAFGFGDEIRGLIGAITEPLQTDGPRRPFGERYREYRDIERAEEEAYRTQNPNLSTALEIGGGLATGGLGAARTTVAQGLLPLVRQGAVLGGTGGAAAGLGYSTAEAPGEQAIDALQGAALGAGAGALLAPVAEGIGTVGQMMRRRYSGQTGADDVMTALRSQADEGLSDAQIVEQAARQLERERGAVVGDLGEETRALLETVSKAPGRTGARVSEELGERSANQFDEVQTLFGQGRVNDWIGARRADRAARAGPMYRAAYDQPTEMTPELRRLWENDPRVQEIWRNSGFRRRARDIAADEDLPFNPALFDEAEPSTMGWDYIIRYLDDQYGRLKISDPGGARRATRLRGRIMDEVNKANPALGEARRQYAGASRAIEAAEEGKKIFRTSSEDLETLTKDYAEDELDAFTEGMASAIRAKLEPGSDTSDATKFFQNRGMRTKLREVLRDDDRYNLVMARLDELQDQQRTFARARPGAGSTTAPILSRLGDQGSLLTDIAIDAATPGTATDTATHIRRLISFMSGIGQRGRRDVAGDLLLSSNPEAVRGLLEQVSGAPIGAPPALTRALSISTPGVGGALGSIMAER